MTWITNVVTWQTSRPSDPKLNITPVQETRLRDAGVWPRGYCGEAYTSVHYGMHHATPSFSDTEIGRIIGGEHAMDVFEARYEEEAAP